MTFLKDTDGDGKADFRRKVLSGFGCEDSHHALHDFAWTPTATSSCASPSSTTPKWKLPRPRPPTQQRLVPLRTQSRRLTSFGTYRSTNPWGVTFDDWGNHVASHPIFATAFHALDPAYPDQHPGPSASRPTRYR